jgi:acetate---CoA ligase (ADP-forming)
MMDRAAVIDSLISPRSIAIIGASADFSKINGRPMKHLIEKGYAGRILPVNPKYQEIAGHQCYPDIENLPDDVDLAVIVVPARAVIAAVEALGRRGIRAAVIFSSGFGEMGPEGKASEARLVEIAAREGVLICGPNCLGFINAFENVYVTFSQYADGEVSAGPIAFVTQSGAFGTAIAALIRQRGLGLGYFINTGNECDLSFADLMMRVIKDPRVKVAAGYLEGIKDGDALIRLAKCCQALGKPLVLTKVGRKAAGQRAAASHTGALAVEDDVLDAVMRQYGILRARNEEQMLDMLEALSQPRIASGPGLAIATQSGGAGVMMADRAEEVGLIVPELSPETQLRLRDVVPAFGAAANPVDVTGQFVAEPELLRETVVALMDDPSVHAGIVWLQLMHAHADRLIEIFIDIRDRTTKPVFVCWTAASPNTIERLRAEGIVVFGAGERAVEAVAALVRINASHNRSTGITSSTLAHAGKPLAQLNVSDGMQPSVRATEWLDAAGINMAPVSLACSADEAVSHWQKAGRPVALKIESPDVAHKSDIGGVILGLSDEATIVEGFETLSERAASFAPDARFDGILVQAMADGHVELVVGVQRSPTFGMVVMVGFGGILVEVLKDVAFRRAPFDVDEATAMLDELRARAILDGVRGQPGVDCKAIATMLARLSEWAAANESWLAELDLNPVLVGDHGPVAVDCVMIARQCEPA